MQRNASSPKAYRASVSGQQRELLDAIRELIHEVAPDIEEGIRYGMLDYPGLANLAAQKNYISLYVAPSVLDKHRNSLGGLGPGKSCVRFRRLAELDADRLRALLRDVLAQRARS